MMSGRKNPLAQTPDILSVFYIFVNIFILKVKEPTKKENTVGWGHLPGRR
ncbi:MAG: hypothetical protein M3015_01225 [Bacteroidota bacterium]|nr:hypothetical protein [Bacteroidota bacterium]